MKLDFWAIPSTPTTTKWTGEYFPQVGSWLADFNFDTEGHLIAAF
jgi:hypothetical protein